MSRIPTHTLASAPVATRPVLETLVARSPTPGVPINLHAQMAHAPSVLIGYMAMRKALDDYGSFAPQTRTAILLTVAAADRCAFTVALNILIARQAGWTEDETLAIRNGHVQDGKLGALLDVARQSAQTRATSTNQRGRRRSTQIGRTRSSPRLSRSLDWRSTSTHSSTTPAPTSIRLSLICPATVPRQSTRT